MAHGNHIMQLWHRLRTYSTSEQAKVIRNKDEKYDAVSAAKIITSIE
jgi:hypothetical protein